MHSYSNAPCSACNDLDGCHMPAKVRHTRQPKIVCLCGSTKFKQQFIEANFRETLEGNIVLSVGWFPSESAKRFLDELHKRKIDVAHEILVINVGGYVGDSTQSEIAYARFVGKPVRYLEQIR
jgi:hypothetical protein